MLAGIEWQSISTAKPNRPGQKPLQRLMIRLVDGLDTRDSFRQRQAAGIDVEPFSHQLGHSAKPAGHARRADVAEGRHGFGEHARIEFPGFPVDVKISAREVCRQHRRAERDGATEQFVDIAIFGAADGVSVQPCHGQEPVRIVTAAMRRVEEEGDALFGARPDFEGRNDRKILGCRFQFERIRKHQCIMVGKVPPRRPHVQRFGVRTALLKADRAFIFT
jgi:hypothetical protein